MTPRKKRLGRPTQRLAGDMKIRHLSPNTIEAYTHHADRFADFINMPLDQATVQDIRNCQL